MLLDVYDIRTHIASGTRSVFLLADINRSWFDPAPVIAQSGLDGNESMMNTLKR